MKDELSFPSFAAAVLPHLKLCDAVAVVKACRTILRLNEDENILIAADELAKLGEEVAVGMVSENAVLGLKALVELSTASLIECQGDTQRGVLYVCGSVYSAYNPAKGITKNSNRPVHYMPLPPLSVEKDDETLRNLYSGEELTDARVHLWSSQYNARTYSQVLLLLKTKDKPSMTGESHDSTISDENYLPDFTSRWDAFLNACDGHKVDPLDLLHVLFWPQPFNKDTTAFHDNFHAALLGDAAGLCTILRDYTAGVDRVYMSPKAVEQLTEELGGKLSMGHLLSVVNEVNLLAKALQRLPAPVGDPMCGKLFEEVMLRAYRCRAATMRKAVSVGDFLGRKACTLEDVLLVPLQDAIAELPTVTIFPRAAVEFTALLWCQSISIYR